MATSDPLTGISQEDRNQLEAILIEFDLKWRPDLLREYCRRVTQPDDVLFTRLATLELIKIDLQRSWMAGQGRLLESYYDTVPGLEESGSLEPDLLFVEFTTRRGCGDSVSVSEYQFRFPNLFPAFARLLSEANDSQIRQVPLDDKELLTSSACETTRSQMEQTTAASERQPEPRDAGGPLPSTFGRYRILRKLGSGAMGAVYLAHDAQLDRLVAIKTPLLETGSQEMVERFHTEARAAGKIRHRNVCPVYDVGEIEGRHFISMAYIQGRPLQHFVKSGKTLPLKTAALIIYRLARALAEAHRHNVVHRDLKPTNIMIDNDGEPVVMDFGLARRTDVDARTTRTGVIVGTPAYMAPEQLTDGSDETGPWTDIYSLGVVFYELLTGRLPFLGPLPTVVSKIVYEEPRRPSLLREDIDPELEQICLKMMAKCRTDRFTSMRDAAAAIKQWLKRHTENGAGIPPAKPPMSDAGSNPTTSTVPNTLDGRPLSQNLPPLPRVAPPSISHRVPTRRRISRRRRVHRKISLLLLSCAAVLAGILLYIQTRQGTVVIELAQDISAVEILLDGNPIDCSDGKSELQVSKGTHVLAVRIGGRAVHPDSQLVVQSSDGTMRRGRVTIELNGARMTDDRFDTARRKTTVIRIAFVPDEDSHSGPSATLPKEKPTGAPDGKNDDVASVEEQQPADANNGANVSTSHSPTSARPESESSAQAPETSVPTEEAPPEPFELRIAVRVEGTGELRIYSNRAGWCGLSRKLPEIIRLNDILWDLKTSRRFKDNPAYWIDNAGATQYMPASGVLVKTRMIAKRGRGKVVLRGYGDHAYLRFDDPQPGAGDYEVVLSIPRQPLTEQIKQTLKPFAGKWQIHYTNGVVRRYDIDLNGRVSFGSEHGRLLIENSQVVFRLNDREMEVHTLVDGQLFVQAFFPPSRYPAPSFIGRGVTYPDLGTNYRDAVDTVVGKWRLAYSNGVTRIYDIRPNGKVFAMLPKGFRRGEIVLEDGNLLVNLADGKNVIETIFRHGNTLYLARFDQINAYPYHARPSAIGALMEEQEE